MKYKLSATALWLSNYYNCHTWIFLVELAITREPSKPTKLMPNIILGVANIIF